MRGRKPKHNAEILEYIKINCVEKSDMIVINELKEKFNISYSRDRMADLRKMFGIIKTPKTSKITLLTERKKKITLENNQKI